jgi:hypothetical protein
MSHMTRNPLFVALAATAALALGACGSGGNDDNSSGGSGAKAQDKAFEGALKFAKCMREHDVDMPDPTQQPGGGILQQMGGKGATPERIDQGAMGKAQKACEHFMEIGGGPAPDPAEQAERQDAFVAYARCMRGHGIDMPDPKFSGNKVSMRIGKPGAGSAPNPESATFKAAEKACHPLLGEVQKIMGKGGKKP